MLLDMVEEDYYRSEGENGQRQEHGQTMWGERGKGEQEMSCLPRVEAWPKRLAGRAAGRGARRAAWEGQGSHWSSG